MRGHVKQRGATWSYWVDAGRNENGLRKQITKGGFATKREAERALRDVIGKLDEGSFVEPSKDTVAKFLRRWLDSIRSSVRPSTFAAYSTLVEAHIIPHLGTLLLQRLSAATLNSFYADLSENGRRIGSGGLSPRTVRFIHAIIHKALSEAVDWRMLPRNVADQARPPRPQTGCEFRTWSASELRRFLDSAASDRLFAAYYLAAYTGMRRGEVLGVRWRDVDMERSTVAVSQTIVSVNGIAKFSIPKTAAGRRSILIDKSTVDTLRAHRVRQLDERTTLGLPWPSPDDLLFTDIDGQPAHPVRFKDHFLHLVKVAGVPRIPFHWLRHTHATLMLTAGVHPKVVQERLGHANITITLQTYSHVIPTMQEEAAAKFAELLEQSAR
jgi:integrase